MNDNLDKEVLQSFLAGQPGGLNAIYKVYYAQIRYYSKKIIKNEQDAEDITTMVFIQLYEKRERFISEQDISAFLFSTARWKCLDLQRSFRKKKTRNAD